MAPDTVRIAAVLSTAVFFMFLAVPKCLFILREDAKKGAGGNFSAVS